MLENLKCHRTRSSRNLNPGPLVGDSGTGVERRPLILKLIIEPCLSDLKSWRIKKKSKNSDEFTCISAGQYHTDWLYYDLHSFNRPHNKVRSYIYVSEIIVVKHNLKLSHH